MGFEIPLVEESLYAKVSDKWAFRTLCQQNRIAIPHEYMSLECAEFPCVAKPRAYFSSVDNRTLDPHILHTRVDLNSFLEYQIESDFYYQRFIEGPSYYLLYYFFKNGTVQKYSQQNLLQQPGGKSIVAAVSSDIHCARVSLQFEELFSSIGFTGLVMVEIKGDDRNLCMIEANPRFWGPSQLFVDAGVNLFEALLLDHGYLHELAPIKTTPNKTRYFWFGGIVLTWKSGMPLAHHTNSDINLHTLISELPKWLRSDVYRRSDTYGYFVSEIIAS
jgi:predicted ATP-grasp superfamily ATP-dependent carboligase